MALQGYFGSNFQPNAKQHNNSHLPIEQNNIITIYKTFTNSSINNFVDRISLVEQAEAELLFAQAIFQCGLFLSLPELESIKALFKKNRPCFKLPSRKAMIYYNGFFLKIINAHNAHYAHIKLKILHFAHL